MIATVDAVVGRINSAAALVCHALLVGITAVTVLQVFLRFALDSPTSWSEEVALLGLIWFAFLSVAIGIRRHQHVAVTFLRDRMPPGPAALLDYAAQAAMALFMFVVVWFGRDLIALTGAQLLPASRISKMWLYMPAIAGGALGCVNALANIATRDVHFVAEDTTEAADAD